MVARVVDTGTALQARAYGAKVPLGRRPRCGYTCARDAPAANSADARRASEPAWQLPLWDEYREQIKSDVADLKNTGGRAGGTITAAAFLKEFVSFPWVHLDVAGTAYSESDLTIIPKGPTGVPMGTFVEFVRGRAS